MKWVAAIIALAASAHALPHPASSQHAFPAAAAPAANGGGLRLIEVEPNVTRVITAEEKDALMRSGEPFMDVTDYTYLDRVSRNDKEFVAASDQLPTAPRVPDLVASLAANLSTEPMLTFLSNFTAFRTRFFDSYTGKLAAEFLYQTVSDIAASSGKKITVSRFKHPWQQFSVIARFEPSTNNENTVIIGAHLDSINAYDVYEQAPGADDDGSGAATILEVFRVLAMTEAYQPGRPLEFHWYSAEEGGLLGSQAVASAYRAAGRKVLAMMQNDQTGYVAPQNRFAPYFGVVIDFVDPTLTALLKQLIARYTKLGFRNSKCGYACSDHASWYKAGYATTRAAEGLKSELSPYAHTAKDTISTLNVYLLEQFSQLVLSFAVELAHIG